MVKRYRHAATALNALVDGAERAPDRTRLLVYPDYQAMTSEDERQGFHRVVAGAERAGAIIVRRDSRAGPADIRSIALADIARLLRFLGRTSAVNAAEEAIADLRGQLGTLPDWITVVVDEVAAAWAVRREPYPGLAVGNVPLAVKFLQILAAIDRGEHLGGLDMRTFSRRACGDSKAVEAGKARLARVLRSRFGLPDTLPREVLSAIGIEKFPQPTLIRANMSLPGGAVVQGRPYIGLAPEWAASFRLIGHVAYVLIIENLASFNRHAREISDEGVVVFSGGFPSRSTLAAIRHLDTLLPEAVPFFHWGDNDRHGRLILEHINSAISRPLVPHLMDLNLSGVEQEALDPVSPVLPADQMRSPSSVGPELA